MKDFLKGGSKPRLLSGIGWGFLLAFAVATAAEDQARTAAEIATIPVPQVIQPAPLRKHVAFLAGPELKGRGAPEDRRRAAMFIVSELQKLKLKPLFNGEFTQKVPGPAREDGTKPIWGMNVGGFLPGSDPVLQSEVVILAAHFDHLGMRKDKIYPGADDNASSVAMMLEVARQLQQGPSQQRRTIAFVGFDLEENLLWGSRWFAAHPPWKLSQVKLFITADLLGRSLGDLPFPAVFVMGAETGTGLTPLLKKISPPRGLEMARLGADLVGTRSDYGPFRDEHVPFLFFSTGEHPDYHTPRDTPDRLNYDKLALISDVILEIVRRAANTDHPPAWVEKPEPDLEEARTVHRITELLDEADQKGTRKLTQLQQFVVSQARNKTAQILQKGSMTPDERAWLIRSAQALLFTVF